MEVWEIEIACCLKWLCIIASSALYISLNFTLQVICDLCSVFFPQIVFKTTNLEIQMPI